MNFKVSTADRLDQDVFSKSYSTLKKNTAVICICEVAYSSSLLQMSSIALYGRRRNGSCSPVFNSTGHSRLLQDKSVQLYSVLEAVIATKLWLEILNKIFVEKVSHFFFQQQVNCRFF